MRIFPVFVVLALSNPARADDAAGSITTAIRAVLDGPQPWLTSDGKHDWYDRLGGAKLGGPTGAMIEAKYDLVHQFAECTIAEVTWKLGTITPTIDAKRGFAWFQVPVSVDETCASAGFVVPSAREKLRASGILVRDKSTWKLVALALSRQLPDAELFRLASSPPSTGEPRLDDAAVSKTVATWFTTKDGFARSKAPGDAVASGTDPGEMANGASALRLAKAWDTIHLHPESIDATLFAGGKIAFVRVDVRLPVKAKAAPMTLYAIAVFDDAAKVWSWTSLQFTTELAPVPEIVYPDASGVECPHGKC